MARSKTALRQAYEAGAAGRDLPEGLSASADNDPLIDQAHDAGRQGIDFDAWHKENVDGQGNSDSESEPEPESDPGPAADKRRGPTRRRPSSSGGLRRPHRPSLRQPLGGATAGASVGHSAAGVALGAVAYALVLSVVDYGPSGPKLWFKAKFLNEPATAKTKSATTSTSGVVYA